MVRYRTAAAAALIVAAALAGTATGSEWCGENGLIRLSFTAGEERTSVHTAASPRDRRSATTPAQGRHSQLRLCT